MLSPMINGFCHAAVCCNPSVLHALFCAIMLRVLLPAVG